MGHRYKRYCTHVCSQVVNSLFAVPFGLLYCIFFVLFHVVDIVCLWPSPFLHFRSAALILCIDCRSGPYANSCVSPHFLFLCDARLVLQHFLFSLYTCICRLKSNTTFDENAVGKKVIPVSMKTLFKPTALVLAIKVRAHEHGRPYLPHMGDFVEPPPKPNSKILVFCLFFSIPVGQPPLPVWPTRPISLITLTQTPLPQLTAWSQFMAREPKGPKKTKKDQKGPKRGQKGKGCWVAISLGFHHVRAVLGWWFDRITHGC